METENIWKYFVVILFILYLILGICYMYFLYRSSLKKKSYSTKKFKSMRKEVYQRFILVGFGIPVIILIAALLVIQIHGKFDLSNENEAFHFFTIFLILTLPFAIFDKYQSKKKYRKFAFDSKAEIVVDFKLKLLNYLFSPALELVVYLIYIGFFLFLEREYHISFSHILVIWLLYIMIRSTKFQGKPQMKNRFVHQVFTPIVELVAATIFIGFFLFIEIDYQLSLSQVLFLLLLYFTLRSTKFQAKPTLKSGYSYTFLLLIINQIVIIYYLVRKLMDQKDLSIIELSIGLFILLALVLKTVYYLANFGSVKKEFVKGG